MVKPLADIGDHRLDLISGRMGKREQQTRLASVLGQAGDARESIPLDGVVRGLWCEAVMEKDAAGRDRVNCVTYEKR